MKCRQLLFELWCLSILAVTACMKVDGYMCVTDYLDSITCVLNITGNPVAKSKTNYSLHFTNHIRSRKVSCPLMVMNHSYRCDCKVTNDLMANFDEYDIDLCVESSSVCQRVINQFILHKNIQLKPPPELVVQQTTETVNITFKSRYDNHHYLHSCLDYEVLLQTPQSSKSNTFSVKTPKKFESIDRKLQLKNTEYCIKARYVPCKNDYSGTWSEWSKRTCWKNEAEEEQEPVLIILAKSLVPVCVAVGALLFVFYSPAARTKIKTLSRTPSPAPFFHPLYQQHKGDLQEWLSPRGKFVLTHKPEETMISDTVAVVPKPIKKDPEESQPFLNPLVIQLAFPQCQTSYVGLPGMDKAPPPIAVVCPGNTSYTQLPCSLWGVGIGEVEVASSPPEDILEISCVDSGCSFEDVTQSPEGSFPNSPVDDTPAPCYCNDYCILNKTAEGVVPVLLSKESSVKVTAVAVEHMEK